MSSSGRSSGFGASGGMGALMVLGWVGGREGDGSSAKAAFEGRRPSPLPSRTLDWSGPAVGPQPRRHVMLDQRLTTPWWTLRLAYGLVPIVAGLDKFTNLLTDWTQYLSPTMARVLPLAP